MGEKLKIELAFFESYRFKELECFVKQYSIFKNAYHALEDFRFSLNEGNISIPTLSDSDIEKQIDYYFDRMHMIEKCAYRAAFAYIGLEDDEIILRDALIDSVANNKAPNYEDLNISPEVWGKCWRKFFMELNEEHY